MTRAAIRRSLKSAPTALSMRRGSDPLERRIATATDAAKRRYDRDCKAILSDKSLNGAEVNCRWREANERYLAARKAVRPLEIKRFVSLEKRALKARR